MSYLFFAEPLSASRFAPIIASTLITTKATTTATTTTTTSATIVPTTTNSMSSSPGTTFEVNDLNKNHSGQYT